MVNAYIESGNCNWSLEKNTVATGYTEPVCTEHWLYWTEFYNELI